MTDTDYEARVLTLPVERTLTAARRTAASAAARQVAAVGTWHVDDWGRDPALVGAAGQLAALRWSTVVGGADHLPVRAGGLIVVNARRYALAPVHAALAITHVTGRAVRFVGRPDVAPLGALARRMGGLLARPDEVAGALRAGELLVMGTSATVHPRRVGRVDHRLIGAAVATKAAVFPAATASSPWSRSARIEIGTAMRPGRRRRGPLIELELADQVEQRIKRILDEFGGTRTGTPLDWLPLSGMGGS
ncbi:MAG TPA: hypothetical protein VFT09_08475 [Ilumatobacteraceae bacterium]|nr:hypothetical protein [Ilumatobacteraceae bacterium]